MLVRSDQDVSVSDHGGTTPLTTTKVRTPFVDDRRESSCAVQRCTTHGLDVVYQS